MAAAGGDTCVVWTGSYTEDLPFVNEGSGTSGWHVLAPCLLVHIEANDSGRMSCTDVFNDSVTMRIADPPSGEGWARLV